jgi:hypothetical protein
MKCEECEVLIEEYVDGELGRAEAAEMAAHLVSCGECSQQEQEVRRELELYARYDREVAVGPALWAAVESRIRQENAPQRPGLLARLRELFVGAFGAPRLSPAFAAAMVLAAVGLTLFLNNYMGSRKESNEGIAATSPVNPAPPPPNNQAGQNSPAQQPPAATNSESLATVREPDGARTPAAGREKGSAPAKQLAAKAQPSTADQLVREAEQKYLAAINILQRDVNRRGTQLEPAVRARFDVALAEIDRTITETRKAVRQNPGDPTALQYLLGAYSKKVDVLREMSRQSLSEEQ